MDPAGVGDDCARADLQAEEVEIADRLHGADAGALEAEQQPFGPQTFRGARVDREENGSVGGQSGERCHDASQLVALVDVGWAMQGHEHVLAAADRKRLPRPAVLGARLEAAQGIDHGVADEVDPAFIDAFGDEVRRGFGAVDEEEVGEPIGEDPVDLLGHRPVPGAQAGLDVRNRDPELGCRQRHGKRRVDVAANAHQFRWILEQDALDGLESARRLRAVGSGSHAEEDVGLGELEVRQQLGRHPGVVMLSGVNDALDHVRPLLQRRDDRGHLDEVRARTDHVDDGGGHLRRNQALQATPV